VTAKHNLLISGPTGAVPDDFIVTQATIIEAKDLLEVIDDSQPGPLNGRRQPVTGGELAYPTRRWRSRPLADAIVDRLVNNAHRMALKGNSMRRRQPEEPPSSP